MGDSATAVNSTALKQNSSPVPNNVNHEPSKNDSISSLKKHHLSSSSHKSSSSPSVKKEHSGSPSKSHSKENSSSSHSSKSHHKHSNSEHKHSSKHKSSSSDHSKHSDHKHHSSSSSSHKRDSSSSAHKSKDSSKHSSSSKSNSSSKEHSGSSSKHHHSGEKSKEKRHSENGVKKENGIDTLPIKSPSSESRVTIKTEPLPSPVKSQSSSPLKITVKKPKPEDSDDDMPLDSRLSSKPVAVKRPVDSDDDTPLSDRAPKIGKLDTSAVKIEKVVKKEKKRKHDDDYGATQVTKKKKKLEALKAQKGKTGAQVKKEKQQAEEQEKWRWWEEDRKDDGTKWKFLEHAGPMFAPPYEPLPDEVKFFYDGKEMKLSESAEEVATFYARMIEHDYTTRDIFNRNFLKDWRKTMTLEEKQTITDLKKCNFTKMHAYFTRLTEERKNRTKEEKLTLKKDNERLVEMYGYAKIDGHTEKIGNFRIEPPGLFRGRGDHPKQGMLKKRTMPEDVIINCSKDAKVPPPPAGHKWKEVRHDNTVSWLACWVENIQGSTKYVMLNAASKLKGEKDWQKYETARKLHSTVDRIRAQYREDWKSKEMRIRQRAVALYFIDKLALRAGNEKDEDQADTVGCCSLRVEHIKLHEKLNDKEFVVEFDFLGKDSIRYYNQVSVEKRVFKNLLLFTDNKQGSDDVFDRLNTAILNKHLSSLMDGLTAKVFRTYNASITLQQQLDLLTVADDPITAKLLSYNRANRAVAILCNHQRAVPKNFSKQMENLQAKIEAKQVAIKDAKKEVKAAKSDVKNMKTEKARSLYERKKKMVERLQEQLTKLEVQATDKDENKEIALGTSKLNYLDPRISVAWCKKWDVPIEKVYNKAQRDKFAWAIDMAESDFVF